MRPLPYLTSAALGLCLGAASSFSIYSAFAQTAPPPAPTCEAQLEQAQAQNIQLRKRLAQAEFQAAAVEEQALALQKQLGTEKTKGAAAQK